MSDPGYTDDETDTPAADSAVGDVAQRRAMDFMVRKALQTKAAANPALAVRPPAPAPSGPLVNAPAPTPRPVMPQDPSGIAAARPPNADAGADDYYNYLDKMDQNRIAAVKEANAPLLKYWEDATKALKDKRSGPTAVERLSQLSAAFFKPTQYSGFGATLGNIMPVLAEQEKAKREDAAQQAELLDKYKLGSVEALTKQNLATIPKDKSAAMLAYMTKMAKAGKGPGIVVDPLRGTARRKDTGAEIMTEHPEDIKDLITFVKQGRGAEASLKFDNTYGPGAAELYLNAAQGAENGGY